MKYFRPNISHILFLIIIITAGGFSQQTEMQKAVSYYQQGKYEDAGKIFESLLTNGIASKEAYSGAIDCALKVNKYKKAITLIEQAITHFGASYEYMLTQAQLYSRLGNNTNAIESLGKATRIFPDSTVLKKYLSEVLTARGAEYYKAGKTAESIADMRSAIKYDPSNESAKKNLALVFVQQKDFVEALPIIKEEYRISPGDEMVQQLYFETLIGMENYEEALKISDTIVKHSPNDLRAGLNNAMLLRHNREIDKAYARYADLRKRFPAAKEVYEAEIGLLTLQSRLDTVVSRYREYLRYSPHDAGMYMNLGKTFERRKLYDSARGVYKEMISRDIDRDAAIFLAESYIKEGNKKDGISEYQKYLAAGGSKPEAFERISMLLSKEERNCEAKDYLLAGIEKNPNRPELQILLAKLFYYNGQSDSAQIFINNVKDSYTDFPEISYVTALLFVQRSDTARALFHLCRAVRGSLEQTQVLQAKMAQSLSGNNAMNYDSLEFARGQKSTSDSLTNVMKHSFALITILTTQEKFLTIIANLLIDVPQSAQLYLQRGAVLLTMGEIEKAESDYTYAIAIAPNSDEAQRSAGEFYETIGKNEKALLAFRIATGLKNSEPYYFRKVIELAIKTGSLNEICDYWLKKYNADKDNLLLKNSLIEGLHKAGRITEANSIINEKN